MNFHWLGIHDHHNSIDNWVKSENQYSWLRAFENLDCKTSALLKIKQKEKQLILNKTVRGVEYYFDNKFSVNWLNKVNQINPTHILWNICYYEEAVSLIKELKKQNNNIFHCIRIHHEVSYLARQDGFLEFLSNGDFLLTATNEQLKLLKDYGYKQPIKVIPFGIDDKFFKNRTSEKDIDFISCCNRHPLRNLNFLKLQYLIMNLIHYTLRLKENI